MVASKVKAGEAFVTFSLQDKFSGDLNKIGANLQRFGAGVGLFGGGITALGVGIITPLVAATQIASKFGDAIDKAFQRTQVSTETLSGLALAAERTGTSFQIIEKAILKSQRSINNSNKSLEALGLNSRALLESSPEEQFLAIADAISKVENPTRQAAIAQNIFGKSGAQLLPLIREGAAGIQAYIKRAEELGISLSREEAGALAKYRDGITDIQTAIRGVNLSIGTALGETLAEPALAIATIIGRTAKWIRANKGLVVGLLAIGAAVTAVGLAVTGLGLSIVLLGAVISAVSTIAALPFIVPVLLIGAAIIAIGSLVAAFFTLSESGRNAAMSIGKSFGQLVTFIGGVIADVVILLANGEWEKAGRVAALKFRHGFATGIRVTQNLGPAILRGLVDSDLLRGVLEGLTGGGLLGTGSEFLASRIALSDDEKAELRQLNKEIAELSVGLKDKFFGAGQAFAAGSSEFIDAINRQFVVPDLTLGTSPEATAIRIENLKTANTIKEKMDELKKEAREIGEKLDGAANMLDRTLKAIPISRLC